MPSIKALKQTKTVKREKGQSFMTMFEQSLEKYDKFLVVDIDNVTSRNIQKIRRALEGQAVVAMGKNTLIRKVLKKMTEKNENLHALLPYCVGNVGFVFTDQSVDEIHATLVSLFQEAEARVGSVSPVDFIIHAGPTNLDPSETGYFQALNIPTRVNRSQLDIMSDVQILHKGTIVEPNAADLLKTLGFRPFKYGFKTVCAYDSGIVYDAEVLNTDPQSIFDHLQVGLGKLIELSLGSGYTIEPAVGFIINNGIRNLLNLGLGGDIDNEATRTMKAAIQDAEKNAEANAAAAAAAAESAAVAAAEKKEAPAAKEEPVKEEEEEEEDDGGFNLFDD